MIDIENVYILLNLTQEIKRKYKKEKKNTWKCYV